MKRHFNFRAIPSIGLSSVLLLLSVLASIVHAQEGQGLAQDAFLQFQQGAGEYEGELQTAITTYRNAQGVELDLVAAVHLAQRSYYDQLNDYFDTRDAVLYELVADENVRPDGSGNAGGSGFIGFIQTSLSNFLGLEFQLNSINYNRNNFVHADLEPAELDAIMSAKGETMFSSILDIVLMEMANAETAISNGSAPTPVPSTLDLIRMFNSADRQIAFKHFLGQSLAATGGLFASTGGGAGITILDDRNDAALDALHSSLQNPLNRRISIFYGAAHMSGLEQGIAAMGFNRVANRWITAWQTP